MKQLFTIIILLIIIFSPIPQYVMAGNQSSNHNKVSNDGSQSGWVKVDNDVNLSSYIPAIGNENVSYYANYEGIYVIINSGSNKIKLYALTGQLLSSGDLTLGRFFSPTRRGIYFLKINNKTYKVICK
jgi:hypothetical protein